jgi:hypothetical protein
MPILVSALNEQILSELDAEGSDRYLFDQDIKPAINAAMDIIVALFNQAFAENKLSPEQLRELTKTQVWQASQYSRIAFKSSEVGRDLWTLISVYPKATTNKGKSAMSQADKSTSVLLKDVSFVTSNYSAKRLTLEEWTENKKNVFMPGNETLKGSLVSYGYLDFSDYSSTTYVGNSGEAEIEIRPAVPGEPVALSYLAVPLKISSINDSVEFPVSIQQLMVDVCLNTLAVKQGDGTNLWGVSSQNIQKLVNAFI